MGTGGQWEQRDGTSKEPERNARDKTVSQEGRMLLTGWLTSRLERTGFLSLMVFSTETMKTEKQGEKRVCGGVEKQNRISKDCGTIKKGVTHRVGPSEEKKERHRGDFEAIMTPNVPG